MKYYLLKANAKKKKYIKTIESDSDGDLSSSDEESQTEFIYKIFNNQYFSCIYLGKGTFSKVYCVYDLVNSKFYAMKIVDNIYDEEAKHEININNLVNNENITIFYDSFVETIDNENYYCLIFELMGYSLLDILNY